MACEKGLACAAWCAKDQIYHKNPIDCCSRSLRLRCVARERSMVGSATCHWPTESSLFIMKEGNCRCL